MSFSSSFQGATDHTESHSDPSQLQFGFPTPSANEAADSFYFILFYCCLLCISCVLVLLLPPASAAGVERTVTVTHKGSAGTQLPNLQWPAHLWDSLEHRSANPQSRRARQGPCLLHHWEEKRVLHRMCLQAAPNSAGWATFPTCKGESRPPAKYQSARVSKQEFWKEK